jgi:hypothetical protein
MLFLLYSFQSLSLSSLALIGHYEQSISKPHAVLTKILIKNQKLLQTLRLYQSLLSFKARLDRKERLNIARKSKRQDRGVLCCLRLGTQGSQDGGKKKKSGTQILSLVTCSVTNPYSEARFSSNSATGYAEECISGRIRFLDAEGDFVGFPSVQELMLLNPKDWDDLFKALAR